MKKNERYLAQQGPYWSKVQQNTQNAVVQIFSQIALFDWLEPYRIGDQFENRGTGFLINEDGYIITNAHVVHEAKNVWINLPVLGRQPIHADIVGFCPQRDLALLKIQDNDLNFLKGILEIISILELGDSDTIQSTENVLVLGYPLGQYRLKSTTGVVSGHELIEGRSLIQITAPVNPGNSGGPLLNIKGEVIGIAIASVAQAHNVGYGIPINELHSILDDLYTIPLVRKPTLGTRFAFASDEKARILKNPEPAGLYITTVFKNSLFDKAGVLPGDMLYEFNGFAIDAFGDARVPWTFDKTSILDLISRLQVGQDVGMVIFRQGEKLNIEFICALTDPWPIRAMFADYEQIEYEVIGGLVIMQLVDNHLPILIEVSSDLEYYNRAEHKQKPVLVITHVMPGSYAQELRTLNPGDIITHTNGKKVKTLAEFRRALNLSIETGYVTVNTTYNVLVVFSLIKIFEGEESLSQNFFYPISSTLLQLSREFQKKVEAMSNT